MESFDVCLDEHPVKQYFTFDKAANTARCMIDETCKKHEKPMKGDHAGNVRRHIKRYHPTQYEEIEIKLSKKKRKRDSEVSTKPRKVIIMCSEDDIKVN